MKKRYALLLLFLIACTAQPEVQQVIPTIKPTPIKEIHPVIPTKEPTPIKYGTALQNNINTYIFDKAIPSFTRISTDAANDNFGIIPVERYDALYKSDLFNFTVLVHIFKFSTKIERDVVLNSELYYVINNGATTHQGNNIAMYLTQDYHRVVVWSSGTVIVYIEAFLQDFLAGEIADAYLQMYPSDLETNLCIDSDGNDHHRKGTTTKVAIDETTMKWTDICMRDFELYKKGEYKTKKGITEPDGLLEGRCSQDPQKPGYIEEYPCARGCSDGACKLN